MHEHIMCLLKNSCRNVKWKLKKYLPEIYGVHKLVDGA